MSPAFTTELRAGSRQAGTGPGSGPQGANDQLATGILATAPWTVLGLQAPRLREEVGQEAGGGGSTEQSAGCGRTLPVQASWRQPVGQSARSRASSGHLAPAFLSLEGSLLKDRMLVRGLWTGGCGLCERAGIGRARLCHNSF